eukprot:5657027-Amphidinium_carterae.4
MKWTLSVQVVSGLAKVNHGNTSCLSLDASQQDALDLVSTIVEQLGEDEERDPSFDFSINMRLRSEFCEALGPTCRATLPLLQFEIATSVQEKAFEVWGALAASSRLAVQGGAYALTLLERKREYHTPEAVAHGFRTAQDGNLSTRACQQPELTCMHAVQACWILERCGSWWQSS